MHHISKIDDYVKHIFRRIQFESRSLGQLGCRGTETKIVDKDNNTERWKAVKGVWDGSSKNNGKSCCGVRDKWITITKIAVPLGIGTAMAADVVGVSVLSGILISSYTKV